MSDKSLKRSLIILSDGSKILNGIPIAFIAINNRPIIMRTIDRFIQADPAIEVIVVLSKSEISMWTEITESFDWSIPVKIVEGGDTRFESVKNGLTNCFGELIAIHDATRPFVDIKVIAEAFELAESVGAVVPVIKLRGVLRKITFDESESVPSGAFRSVQYPQVFKANIIKLAYEQTFHGSFRDDATVVEACGHDIVLIEGNEANVKISSQFDLDVASYLSK